MRTTTARRGSRARKFLIAAAACMLCLMSACGSPSPSGSPDVPPSEDGETVSGGIAFEWDPDADCAMCHAKEEASRADAGCQLSRGHAQTACAECHVDADALAGAHEQASAEGAASLKRLKRTEVADGTCLACHTDDYGSDAAAGFAGCTDRNGTTVNPHDLSENESHADIRCVSCHKQHAQGLLDETAPQLCVGCHHDGVYECGTCH